MKWWWWKLLRYARPQAPALALIGLASLAGIGIKLLMPWPLKLIVDYALVDKPLPPSLGWLSSLPGADSPQGLLGWLAAATVVLFLSKRLLGVGVSYVRAGASNRMVYGLATDLFQHLQNRSLVFHGKQRVGDLLKRVTDDCSCVKDLTLGVYLPLFTAVVTLVSMFLVMWQLDSRLALFALGLSVPLGLLTGYFARPMSELHYREMELHGEMTALAEQTLSAVPIVQAFGREEEEERRFRTLAHKAVRANLRSLLSQEQFKLGTGVLTTGAATVVTVAAGFSVLDGSMSVGSLLVVISYFAALYSPLENLAYLGTAFATAGAAARRVLEVTATDEQSVKELEDARPLPNLGGTGRGHIRLEDVTFGYEPGRPVIHQVSLEARAGEVLALVGPTGAGKSTLVSLIARLYDPWEGTVWFDNTDLRTVQLSSLHESIAIVMQEPFLFRLTVAENIAYGRPSARQEEIVAAAKAACAHEFIRRLPNGYETVIGERGMTLSGGEKQRLSIARALLKDAPVLILDEPTSAVDAETESVLMEAIEHLMEDRTTFIIAHRLSTVRRADQIVVLEDGWIVECGSRKRWLSSDGRYAQLERLQTVDRVPR